MAGREQVLDRLEGCRLDDIDHHRRRQHGDAPGADKRRRVFGPDNKLGGTDETGRDTGEIDHGCSDMCSGLRRAPWPILNPMSSLPGAAAQGPMRL